jgi:hypothetical protein
VPTKSNSATYDVFETYRAVDLLYMVERAQQSFLDLLKLLFFLFKERF